MSPRRAASLTLCCVLALTGCELVAGGLPDPVRTDAGAGGSAATGGSATGGSAGKAQTDAGGAGAAAGQGGSPGCKSQCDCDGDGAKSKACGGNDCDDHDPNAKPGQSSYFATASSNSSVGFDYNCDGKIERDPTLDKQVNCSGVSLVNCDTTTQGFIDALPACGATGNWGTCKKGAVSCQPDVIDSQHVMKCH